ncbi:MAG: nucleotidyltransferase [Chloroflexi bacterium]|nr:nucleotidyltransferase [Chloroflexota bacterium]
MAIPEAQLDTWSHQGSVKQSSTTYATVRSALVAEGTAYSNKETKVFLQGSYGNATNIYAESDVDIVIVLRDCWRSDLTKLSESEKRAYGEAYPDATYTYADFKRDVTKVLTDRFGGDVRVGNKAIAISAGGGRRNADVIATIQYRRYYRFNGIRDQQYDEGVCFYTGRGEQIVNYPVQHSTNLTARHQVSSGRLKAMIRILKNARSRLVETGLIGKDVAPSYYIEGLLYNVPPQKFVNSRGESFVNVLRWFQEEADKSNLVCANEQYYLLRTNALTCWEPTNCEEFAAALIRLWNAW